MGNFLSKIIGGSGNHGANNSATLAPQQQISLPSDFDPEYYKQANPQIDFTKISPQESYLTEGWKQGLSYKAPTKVDPYADYKNAPALPSDQFDEQWYLKQHPDVAALVSSGQAPSAQAYYLKNGQATGQKGIADLTDAEMLKYFTDKGYAVNNTNQINDVLARNPNELAGFQTYAQGQDPTYNYNANGYVSPAQAALDQAKQRAQQSVTDKGLNYADYQTQIEQALNDVYKTVPYGNNTNADAYFDPNTASNTLDTIQGNKRSALTNQFDQAFTPNYADNAFAGTGESDAISKILNEQYGNAFSNIEGQKKRGALNDTGYTGAVQNLDQQRVADQSKLQGIGNNVLSGYKGQLADLIAKGRSQATGYNLGNTFDPSAYQATVGNKASELSGSLEGDIRNQVGPDSLFDVSSAIGRGYSAQGPQNNGRQAVLDALSAKAKERNQARGLGNTGTF